VTISPHPLYDFDATWETFGTGEFQIDVEGIPMQKLPDDLERYTRLLGQARPELIIEVGTRYGGSAIWFASVAQCPVVSIDIDHTLLAARDHALSRDGRIHWILGNSIAPSTFKTVAVIADEHRRVMVVLDGEHAAPHVLAEIALYRELVTPGQYLVVEDGVFDLAHPTRAHLGGARIPTEGGPLAAIDALLPYDPRFYRDVELEGLTPRSYHPAGFWRREVR